MSESPAADDNTGTNSIWIKAPVVAQRLGILEVTRLPLGRKNGHLGDLKYAPRKQRAFRNALLSYALSYPSPTELHF